MLVGFYARGGIQFRILGAKLSPREPPKALESPLADAKLLSARRVWTERNGMRQVDATFIRLEGDQVHFLRQDGRRVVIPLDALSATDQQVVKRLAEQSGAKESPAKK